MAPKEKQNMSKDRENILKKKKEAEKARLARIKNDPIKLAEYKEKQRLQYLKKKEKGQRKSIKDMTPREQLLTRKEWKKYSSKYRQKKQLLKNNTDNFVHQNTPSTTDDEAQPIVGELIRSIVNEDRRANEAKSRSETQRKFRNKQLKEMKAMVLKLKTKLNNQRQKYRRLKRQLKKVVKSVEKTPKTRIEEMSEDITKKKELVKKALFGEVIKIQLEENYTKIKSHEDKRKFKQAISGNVVDKYKLWRIPNEAVTFKQTGYSQPTKKNVKGKVQSLVQQFLEDDSNSREAAGKKEFVTRFVIEGCEIEKMNTLINDKSSQMIAFKGTLLVHQVTGSAYIPNHLTMKSLSCFCDADACDHFKLGSIHYQTEMVAEHGTHLNVSTVFTDSEDDDIPLSTYGYDRSKLDSDLSAPGVSGYSQRSLYSSGDYLLVKYITRNTEYSYAPICSSVDDEEGELRVTFLKICKQNGTLFQLNEKDVADVPMEQVVKKLPVPNIITKGNRVFYQFREQIDVFEK